mmetsp:Transcript_5955/g.9305  ORF Transcript_5955/g.9305 Transcript_5955/m.9305 type:complete len:82 (-) Transcript_5955:177-422(-)
MVKTPLVDSSLTRNAVSTMCFKGSGNHVMADLGVVVWASVRTSVKYMGFQYVEMSTMGADSSASTSLLDNVPRIGLIKANG